MRQKRFDYKKHSSIFTDVPMTLPREITPDPIREAVIEIRFKSTYPSEAIFGILYEKLREEYPAKPVKLPISDLPESFRNANPESLEKPYYQLHGENYLVQIGPRVLSLVTKGRYMGWSDFSNRMVALFENIRDLEMIESVHRVGVRYINAFSGDDLDIFERIRLQISYNENPEERVTGPDTLLKTTMKREDLSALLHIVNSVVFEDGPERNSVIDIDVSIEGTFNDFFKSAKEMIDRVHAYEKEIFFGLLKEDFLKTLNPEY